MTPSVDRERLRDPVGPVRTREPAADVAHHGIVDVLLAHELQGVAGGVAVGDAQHRPVLPGQLLLGAVEDRRLRLARLAPGRKQVHHDHFATQAGEGQLVRRAEPRKEGVSVWSRWPHTVRQLRVDRVIGPLVGDGEDQQRDQPGRCQGDGSGDREATHREH